MKKAVLFDMDGTLVDSIPLHYIKDKAVLKEVGFDLTQDYFNNECNGKRVEVFYKEITDKLGLDDKKLQELLHISKVGADKLYDEMELFPHVKELIDTLHDQGMKLAIVSNGWHDQIQRVIKHNNLPITIYFGKDDVVHGKPDPEPLIRAAKALQVSIAECIMVGDSVSDMLAGKNANIPSICIPTSIALDKVPENAIIVKEHKDLLAKIQELVQ